VIVHAREFCAKVPEREFSPAAIQSFLLENRCSARLAVEKALQWIDRTREEKGEDDEGAFFDYGISLG
jgi:chaperone BCS1